MKSTLLLFFTLSIFKLGFAQPSYYEFQRSIASANSSAAYIEAISAQARTPNAAYQQASMDKNAINNMVAGWKQSKNLAPLYSKEELAYREKLMKRADSLKEIDDQRKEDEYAAYKTSRNAFGGWTGTIEDIELDKLAKLTIDSKGNLTGAYASEIFTMPRVVDYFITKLPTDSFTNLLSLVLRYEILPITAIKHLHLLEKRFPDYQEVIDLTIVKVLANYYESINVEGKNVLPLSYYDVQQNKLAMGDIFFSMCAKYPAKKELFHSFFNLNSSPYSENIKVLLNQKKKNEAYAIITEFLKIPNENLMPFIKFTAGEYLETLDYDQIKELASLHNAKIYDLVLGSDYDASEYITWNKFYEYGKWNERVYFDKRKANLLKQLVEDGNAEAQNLYAIRIALGFEKKVNKMDAIEWFNKSIAGGNKNAEANLANLCSQGLKGFKDYCK